MKKLILTVLLICIASMGYCDTYVNGYYKKNGTYVQPYYRSSPNNVTYDNYSTKGNYNPYTGQKGYSSQEYNPYQYKQYNKASSQYWQY